MTRTYLDDNDADLAAERAERVKVVSLLTYLEHLQGRSCDL
jgi:hypothetical protein